MTQCRCLDCGNVTAALNRGVPWILCGKCGMSNLLIEDSPVCPSVKDEDYEEKYHQLIDAVKRSRMQHGDCDSWQRYDGVPKACTACMANLKIEEEIKNYKGRTIRLA